MTFGRLLNRWKLSQVAVASVASCQCASHMRTLCTCWLEAAGPGLNLELSCSRASPGAAPRWLVVTWVGRRCCANMARKVQADRSSAHRRSPDDLRAFDGEVSQPWAATASEPQGILRVVLQGQ